MRKWIFALIAAVLALPVFGSAVLAEEEVVYEDGEYEIIAKALNASDGSESGAAGFLHEEAILSINNGEITLTIAAPITEGAEIAGLQIEGIESNVTTDNDNQYFSFKLTTLTENLDAQVQYQVPAFNIDHDVPLKFALEGLSDIPVVEEDEQENTNDQDENLPEGEEPDTSEETDKNEDAGEETSTEDEDQTGNDEGTSEDENQSGNNEDNESENGEEGSDDNESTGETEQPEEKDQPELDISNLEDGFYTIGADYLYIDRDDPSTMGSYLDDSIFLEVKNGKVEVTVTINEDETVTLLQVAGKDSIESKVEGEERHETFEFDELESILNAYVEYQAPFGDNIFEGDAEFRIVLDENTIAMSEESAKPGFEIEGEGEGKQKKDPKPTPTPTPNPDPNPEPTENPLAVDRAYEINYTILDENGNAVSAADQFFEKPAILLEKDGVYYVQITTNADQYIDSLSNQYGDFLYVGTDENGNHVYQFRVVGELTDEQIIDMVITVPGFYNQREHTTRLVLDPDSMTEVNAEDYQLAASEDNANGPNPDGSQPGNGNGGKDENGENGENGDDNGKKSNLDDNSPEKPESGFGSGDNGDSNGENGTSGSDGLNPKTGENTNIMLYVLLMLASAVPLVIKARKHFA